MTKHQYAILGHHREKIGRVFGVISILASPYIGSQISGLLQRLVSATSASPSLLTITITAGFTYFILDCLFNNYIWRIGFISSLLGLPNFNGRWQVSGQTLEEEGNVKYDWSAVWEIEQSWKEISIRLYTSQSESLSYTATLLQLTGGRWQVSYSYSNEPNIKERPSLNAHKGFCELVFSRELVTAEGSYFNSMGRNTFGHMSLKKIG